MEINKEIIKGIMRSLKCSIMNINMAFITVYRPEILPNTPPLTFHTILQNDTEVTSRPAGPETQRFHIIHTTSQKLLHRRSFNDFSIDFINIRCVQENSDAKHTSGLGQNCLTRKEKEDMLKLKAWTPQAHDLKLIELRLGRAGQKGQEADCGQRSGTGAHCAVFKVPWRKNASNLHRC